MRGIDKTEAQLINELTEMRQRITELQTAEAGRKQAEEQLLYREEHFRSLIENALDAIVILNNDASIRYESPSIERVLGLKPDRIGKDPFEPIYADDMPQVSRALTQLVQDPSTAIRMEVRVWHQDGSLHTLEAIGRNLLNNAAVEGIVVNLRDITERKQAEEQIQYQAQLIANVSDAIIASDEKFVITFWNPAAERMYGWKAEEVLGRSGQKLLRSEFISVECSEVIRTLAETGQFRGEMIQYHKDSKPIYVETIAIALKDRHGQIIRTVSVNRDITERKRAEQALQESQESLRLIFESVTDGITVTDLNGVIVDTNKRVLEMHGFSSKEEVLGKSAFELIAAHDHERAMVNMQKTLTDGAVNSIEYTLTRADGSEFTGELSASTLGNGSGIPGGFVAITRDITERKQAEKEMQCRVAELDTLNAVAKIINESVDMDQMLNLTMDAVLRLIGMEAGAIMLLDEESELVTVASRGVTDKMVRAACRFKLGEGLTGRVAQTGEPLVIDLANYSGRLKKYIEKEHIQSGAVVPLVGPAGVIGTMNMASVAPHYFDRPTLQLLLALGRQLATGIEKIRLQQSEMKMAAISEADRVKSTLLSVVSHELRTPLAAIKGYSTLLLDYGSRLSRNEKRQYLESIETSADRLTELIDHLLDMSRLEAGLFRLNVAPTKIDALIGDAVAEARLRSPEHRVLVELEGELPILRVDGRRIRQVLDNLLDNATKYSDKGTEVMVRAETKAMELEISVADQGRGIPATEIDRVFDRMCCLESRLAKNPGGMGLGLALCKALVESHGGRIWVESKVGKGSTVYFALPTETTTEGRGYGEEA